MNKGQSIHRAPLRARAEPEIQPGTPGCDVCGCPVAYRDTLPPGDPGGKPLHRAYCRRCAPPYESPTGGARKHRWR